MDFPVSEFEQRTLRAQKYMAEQGLDALFMMSEPEVRYFTGFRTLFWQSPTRPWFVVLPASGKPIAIVPEIGAALIAQTWVDDVRSWSSPHNDDDGVSMLVDCLKQYSKIGMMMGRESVLRMPLVDFQVVSGACSGSEFVDATALMNGLRFVKSEREIETLSEICSIASHTFDQAGDFLRVGQTKFEAFSQFKQALLKNGAEDVPYLVGGAGQLGYDDVISPPDDVLLKSGDVLMLDTGATLRGYFCDFDRNFCFGQPADNVAQAHEKLWQATEAALGMVRPGVSCAEIFYAMHKMIGGQSNVGRYGHGLGMQLTEFPSIIEWDNTVMEEGAVMTLEPSMAVEGGCMLVHEENIVIRDGSPQLLTKRTSREMPQI